MTVCVGNIAPYMGGFGGFEKISMFFLYFDRNFVDENTLR